MIELIRRDLRIYFRDTASVFFSLLTVIITIGMYVLFLAELQVNTIKDVLEDYHVSSGNVDWIMNTWIIAGLLSIIPVTSSLASLSVMVQDCEKKIMMDFRSMPMKPYKYPLAVIISSTSVGTIMGVLGFIIYSIFIGVKVQKWFSVEQVLLTLGLIVITSLMSSSLMGWLATFFKTSSGFTSLNIVVGTIIGFANAVYVPIGVLPDYVKFISKLFPTAHVAMLFRNILMKDSMNAMFKGAPAEARKTYAEMYGIEFYNKRQEAFPHNASLGLLIGGTVISFMLFIIFYNRKKEEY